MNQNQIRVFKDTKKRANEFAAYTDANGNRYPWVPRDLLEVVDTPTPPEDFSDETYFRTELEDAPYVVYTRKPDEMIVQAQKGKLQAQIDALEGDNPMARPTREFMLMVMEKEAVAAGFTVEDLRANHIAYRKVKELDEQIADLRSQIAALP